MAEIKQASGERAPRKRVTHLMLKKAKGGGHIVEHHYEQMSGAYHEPEPMAFGKDQGHEMMAHVGKMMGVKLEEHSEEKPQEEIAEHEGSETGPQDEVQEDQG